MLSRGDIERIARTVSRGNAGHAEKLYLQDIILLTVSRETVDELVFKGETALLKCYQLDRFSEDLDFTARAPIDWLELVSAVVRNLENFGATVDRRSHDEATDSFTARFGIQGPLFTGDPRSLCFIRLQVNKRSSVVRARVKRYNPAFDDVPSFELAVLGEPEILAEKVRALLTRDQPRDLYDIYHLLERGHRIDPALVQVKLDYYGLAFDPDAVRARAAALNRSWETLEPLTYSRLPPFEAVLDVATQHLSALESEE